MKIIEVRTRTEAFELTRPYTIAFRTVSDVEMGLVEIETDGGHIGRGCASPEPFVTGETREACAAALANDLSWLEGEDVRALPRLCRQLESRLSETPAARAALDMALHDLLAQQLGVPLVEMLGRAHESLPTSITIGIKSVDETLDEAKEYLGRGFRVLKVKLGHSLEEDLARLKKLRDELGTGFAIRVDPNQGYSAGEVSTFVDGTAHLDIEFLEQPMPADQVAELRALPETVRRRVAADETLLNEANALELVAPPVACGIFNIKLMKCGGIHAAGRIADIADTAGVELMWGCMDESVISISAALHAALASPATRYLDLDGSFDLARDVAGGGFVLEDGCLRTTDAPGLGLTPAD
ncbi:MAG: dipeptide epimerase [Gammaproteobacteria bacterium]|nr:dipeptide epimerase [Gammaproteobacteria bacterium]